MTDQGPLRKQFSSDTTIFTAGDASDLCYQIFSGEVHIILTVQGYFQGPLSGHQWPIELRSSDAFPQWQIHCLIG